MSALQVRRAPKCDRLCANRCQGMNGARPAIAYVTLLGYPMPGTAGAGFFCGLCSKRFVDEWRAALTGEWLEHPAVSVCACGCGQSLARKGSVFASGHQHRLRAADDEAQLAAAVIAKRRARAALAADSKLAA